jgi:hypothetical protein
MNLNPVGWASRALVPLLRIIRTSPNATVPVVVVSEPVNSETSAIANSDIALVAKGTGATLAQVPDGTVAGGNKRGAGATDWQKSRNSADQVASAPSSVIVGGERNRASGSWSAIVGGFLNIASGDYSAVAAGRDNSASSSYSFIGGGQTNAASTNTHATVCGGNNNLASGQYSFVGGGNIHSVTATNTVIVGGNANSATALSSAVCGGSSNSASGQYSFIGGGLNNLANSANSVIAGGRAGTTRSIVGYHVFPACSIPVANALGATQAALLLLGRQTTDATATVLTSNTSAASTTNQVILPNNSAYSFSGEVIAGVTDGGDTARWTINGAIKRGANAASTAMVGTATVTMTHNDAGAAAWTVAVTADTTNGGIKVEVTGAAATTIRWICKINTTEMTF